MLNFRRTSLPEDTDQFENLEHNNSNRLHVITRELDDLHQRTQAEEGQPTGSLHHIEIRATMTVHITQPTYTH